MFGSERLASFAIGADKIYIDDACLSFRNNYASAQFRLSSFTNPGYVIDSDDFKITFIDENENRISTTSTGLSYKTTPGSINIGDWNVWSPTVSESTLITFSFQPQHNSMNPDTMVKISLPADDFILPSPCLVEDNNQYIDLATIDCSTDGNSLIFKHVLKEAY